MLNIWGVSKLLIPPVRQQPADVREIKPGPAEFRIYLTHLIMVRHKSLLTACVSEMPFIISLVMTQKRAHYKQKTAKVITISVVWKMGNCFL